MHVMSKDNQLSDSDYRKKKFAMLSDNNLEEPDNAKDFQGTKYK